MVHKFSEMLLSRVYFGSWLTSVFLTEWFSEVNVTLFTSCYIYVFSRLECWLSDYMRRDTDFGYSFF